MKEVLKVITGSKLHRLDNEKSDTDYRGVFMADIKDILSPFKTVKNTSWIEGDDDNTSYELAAFCKMLTRGNPSALEVLWSDKVEFSSDVGDMLRLYRDKFLDTHNIFEAFRGYAHNQYKKMNLFEPDARTPKFDVAYIRTLQQGVELLSTGTFSPELKINKELLLEVKIDFNPHKHVPILAE